MVTYSILELKSANNLGVKLLTKDSEFKFRDNKNIVQLVTSKFAAGHKNVSEKEVPKSTNPLISFFSSLRSQAEAQPVEKGSSLKPWQRRVVR